MSKEYYQILWVPENATADEIKKAYRKKAMECHPDRHGWDKTKEAEFKKLNEAYGVLSDPQKKSNYDQFGSAEGMGGFWWFWGGFQWGFDASDLGDIFSSFFGGGMGGGRGRKRADIGEDIEMRMKISLEDAIRGNTRRVEFTRKSACASCHGKWWETQTCTTCRGSGQVREQVRTVFGVIEQARACGSCSGTGEQIIKKCETCHGKKYEETKIKKDIEIPAGIEDGMSIKIRWEGHAGADGAGDLYITFEAPTREAGLERDGHMLHYALKISPAEAVLGCEKTIEIPIIGKKSLTIQKWTQGGDTYKFAGEGIVRLDRKGSKWDLMVHYVIDIPTKLSSDEKKLYEALFEVQWGKKAHKGFLDWLFGE